jgi:hypothetical protein
LPPRRCSVVAVVGARRNAESFCSSDQMMQPPSPTMEAASFPHRIPV